MFNFGFIGVWVDCAFKHRQILFGYQHISCHERQMPLIPEIAPTFDPDYLEFFILRQIIKPAIVTAMLEIHILTGATFDRCRLL